jgi:hypothetical protein
MKGPPEDTDELPLDDLLRWVQEHAEWPPARQWAEALLNGEAASCAEGTGDQQQ